MHNEIIFIVIGIFMFGVFIGRFLSSSTLFSTKSLERKVDAIIDHLGIDLYKDIPEEVTSAIKNGERIKAIKLYRHYSGLGLKEAADAISDIEKSVI